MKLTDFAVPLSEALADSPDFIPIDGSSDHGIDYRRDS